MGMDQPAAEPARVTKSAGPRTSIFSCRKGEAGVGLGGKQKRSREIPISHNPLACQSGRQRGAQGLASERG